MSNIFYPGKLWLDTDGNPIQAHGGSILVVNNKFYWYGENKEKTTGKDDIWHWGVRCYSSTDLYNWKSEGIIIPPDLKDSKSPLNPRSMMDRPHILYNSKTNKYVAWLKIMAGDKEKASFAILEADWILGPYRMVNPAFNPNGLDVGDFDLAKDFKTNKAYLYSQKPHNFIYTIQLNDTYTGTTGDYITNFHHSSPPFAREAPAHFVRDGKHYLFTSGTTGYHPNPTEVSVCNDFMGMYRVLGNPCVGDKTMTTFNSQISSVFNIPNSDVYIALADRWITDLDKQEGHDFYSGTGYKKTEERFKTIFDPNKEFVFTAEDAARMKINTSKSRYVWLPVQFKNNVPQIKWYKAWKWEDSRKE